MSYIFCEYPVDANDKIISSVSSCLNVHSESTLTVSYLFYWTFVFDLPLCDGQILVIVSKRIALYQRASLLKSKETPQRK